MKTFVTLVLLLALPGAITATETKTRLRGHPVTIVTEVTAQTPSTCLAEFDRQIDEQGWHDQIYRSCDAQNAFTIYCQRDSATCATREVKITLWRAAVKNGKTHVVKQVVHLLPSEINRFLDQELFEFAAEFKATALPAS